MPTFFEKHTATFHQANIVNGQVETLPFLSAAQVLVTLLESLGTAFSPVRSDIQGNINVFLAHLENQSSL
jgi:hypothetical protein